MFHHTKILIISAVALSLAACSTGSNSTNSPTSPDSSLPTSSENSPSSQTTDTKISATIPPGVSDIKDVKLTPNSKGVTAGFFNGASGSTPPKQDVSKSKPFVVGGWAILPTQGKVADKVIITAGDNNTVVAVVPTNIERPDVVQVMKNPAYKNSGWVATINPASLPTGQVVLKAWAYNSESKDAIQLNNAFEANILP